MINNIFIARGLLLLLMLISGLVIAQDKKICYQRFLDEGQRAYNALDFDTAIKKFEAANICWDKPENSDILSKIEAAQNGYIAAIRTARDSAESAKDRALVAQRQAEKQFKRAESGRIAFLADQQNNLNNQNDALALGYYAYKLVEANPSIQVKQAFGNATYHNSMRILKQHEGQIVAAAFSTDGQLIFSADSNNKLCCWTLEGKLVWEKIWETPIYALAYSPTDDLLLVAMGQKAILLNPKGEIVDDLKAHESKVYQASFSSDGQHILTASRDKTVFIWRKDGYILFTLEGHQAPITKAIYSPDTNYILTLSNDKTVRIWDKEGELVSVLSMNNQYITDAQFSMDSQQVITTSSNKEIAVWSLDGNATYPFPKHQNIIRSVTYSPDNTKLIVTDADAKAVWYKVTGERIKTFDQHEADVTYATFSPDSRLVLTTSKDKTAKLWDDKGDLIMNLDYHQAPITKAIFSPDGHHILTFSADGELVIVDTPNFILEQLNTTPPTPFSVEKRKKYGIEK